MNGLKSLDEIVGDSLRKHQSGNVLIFIEDINATCDTAEGIETGVECGLMPSISFLNSYTRLNSDVTRLKQRVIWEQLDINTREMLTILDKYSYESGRIRLFWESNPELLENRNINIPKIKELLNISTLKAYIGDFDSSLDIFKEATFDLAKISSRREDRVVDRIDQFSKDRDIAEIIVPIGSAHSRIGFQLTTGGNDVKRTFANMEERRHIFNNHRSASRYLQITGKDPTELEWYKYMIGNTMEAVVMHATHEEGSPINDQQILPEVYTALKKITDMEMVRNFERNVRVKGFYEAYQTL